MNDKKIIVKITDLGTICELPSGVSREASEQAVKAVKEWLGRDDASQWLVTPIPVEIIDCRVATKPQ
jgi:hypothetical protein